MSISGNSNLKPEDITVVLLAAGHGTRMRPLTNHTPKPLLKVGTRSLIEHHLVRLAAQGFKRIVINIAHMADQFEPALGDGSKYGLDIAYSNESESGALETAGGLVNAMPLIASDPFLTVNADIWTDFDLRELLVKSPLHARLVMVSNPKHNPTGDFELNADGLLCEKISSNNSINNDSTLTYSGIAIYRKSVFKELSAGKQALAPIFRQLIKEKKLEGLKLAGKWQDIGTPERLNDLRLSVRDLT